MPILSRKYAPETRARPAGECVRPNSKDAPCLQTTYRTRWTAKARARPVVPLRPVPEMPGGADTAGSSLAEALDHVESLPLGDTVIVHNRESGAMVATNAFGAMLVDHLRATPDAEAVVATMAEALELPDSEVRGAVQATLARWAVDGLFLTALRPFPMTIPYHPPQGGAQLHLGLGSRAVLLRSEDAALVEDIARALAPMGLAMGAAVTGEAPVRLDVIRGDEGYWAFRGGAPIWGVAGYELTRFQMLREIMDALCGPERVSAHLHASAMALDGAALVFAGASGSGKSTLATLLLGAGAALAADDHVAVDLTGEALFAFPTRPNLKPGTAELPQLRAIIAAQGQGQGRGDFVPKARLAVGTPVRLAGVVFPRYAPDGDNTLTELAPDAALRELIQTGSRVSRITRSIAPLLHALNARPTFRLSYRDTDFAVTQCLSLFKG